ncbi:MAG: LysM peptidoglycan-binding domain-containing protein [Candidatus Limnocylindrales bacterium]
MSERGLPSADASPACPFVAFEDDRDERADRPDHRHRCYAEPDPAPRALAHQEAYCLSSAFPVCPVFQEWARRESARARAADETAAQPPASATVTAGGRADEWVEPPRHPGATDDDEDEPIESTPRRNPPRDWAAPPPWASGAGGGAGFGASRGESASTSGTPAFLDDGTPREARGLAGSAADRLAGGRPGDVPSTAPDPDLASLVAGTAAAHRAAGPTPDERLAAERAAARTADDAVYARQAGDFPSPTRTGRRPAVSSTRGSASVPERDRPRAPQREHVQSHEGPSWERARRNEAYPQIKSRVGMPALPRVVVLALALAVAAVGLFFLPALIGIGSGGGDTPSATPSASVAPATATPAPTEPPAPTPQTYTIAQGDTLSKIAKEFGLTLEQLLEANKDTIENPDRISVGDVINIPIPPPDEVGGSVEPSIAP